MELILLAIAAGGYWYYTQFQKFASDNKIKVQSFKLDGKKTAAGLFTTIYGTLVLSINNPSQFVITMRNLNLNFYYGSKLLGNVKKDEPITLQSGNINYSFNIAISTLNLFSSIQAAIQVLKSGAGINLTLKGTARLGEADVTINESVKLI